MSKKKAKKADARARLIETAERLFYAEGIRTVGIDRIIAEAEVAKMTLYNHFASKDDLILAVLQYREEQVNEMFTKSIERYSSKGMSRLEGFFAALKKWLSSREFRGCSFINATVELADANHAASKFSAAHKERITELLRELIVEAAGDTAAQVTDAVSLLVEGAIICAVIQGSSHPADVAKEATLALISQNSKQRR